MALGLVKARFLRRDVSALGLLGDRRPSVLRLLRLPVPRLALLELRLVRILGVNRWLLRDVRRLGVLVHGDFIRVSCDSSCMYRGWREAVKALQMQQSSRRMRVEFWSRMHSPPCFSIAAV